MKSNMLINVEFLGGTDIQQAVEEAKNKSALWDVAYVCFRFNDRSLSIGRNADVCDVMEEWRSDPSSKDRIIAA